MKGSILWKLAYVFCALTGILAGYGVFSLIDANENRQDSITKDNTLVREGGDSVFFDEGATYAENKEKQVEEEIPQFTVSPMPTVTSAPTLTPIPVATETPETVISPTVQPEETISDGQAVVSTKEAGLPSLASRLTEMGVMTIPEQKSEEQVNVATQTAEQAETGIQETFTYPAKIFGQTPIINRSDAYVSYFEFCYDLIAMVEQEVAVRGLNINVLMTKFALKALFCGVDIEKLDINAPIPRRLAALCLWLAAQVLNESGCDTSSQSAGKYVTDIYTCSSSERKAIAYLYEQGIIKGYQTAGQRFYPEDGLKNDAGKSWLLAIKQCWK